jgi:hypothetical protein
MDSKATAPAVGERVTLKSENGTELTFTGRLFSESSYYDQDTAHLTRLRLFVTDSKELVYSIISGAGTEKTRRYYTVTVEDELCLMSDGVLSIRLPVDMLFSAVFGLCGIDPSRAEELRPLFEENLRAANS